MKSPLSNFPSIPSAQFILERADHFYLRHQKNPDVRRTYGYFTHHVVAPMNQKRLRHLLDVCQKISHPNRTPLKVLDLACGGGLITCAISHAGHQVLGLDLSHEEIQMAQLFSKEENLSGQFLQADLLEDPQWESKVESALGGKPDLVTLAYALHHLPRVEEFLFRLGRWLEPGAHLMINEENPAAPLFRLKHQVRTWIQNDTETEWHRSFQDWKKLLEHAGFCVDPQPTGIDFLPGFSRFAPTLCWSLIFTAERREQR